MHLTFVFLIAIHDSHMNSVKQFSSGFMAGVAAKTIVYPLDVAKKRLQLQDFIHSRNGFGKVYLLCFIILYLNVVISLLVIPRTDI